MIYLFDDKYRRQADYGWSAKRIEEFSNYITPIYLLSEIDDKKRLEIFSSDNIILFHESFFDNQSNKIIDKNALEIRNKLIEYSKANDKFIVLFFSGSKATRVMNQNIGHLPVSILYQNLSVFLEKIKGGNLDLRFIIFGKNPNIEEDLINKLKNANNKIEDSITNENPPNKNFIARTKNEYIERVFNNAKYETFTLDEKSNFEITDEYLHLKINEWFLDYEYDNIFIPLCFGPTLSDFNGLRLATHIRCTVSPNRLKNIYIYSFVDYSYLINNEYFDILKTKNIQLIDYRKEAFQLALETYKVTLTVEELSIEISKIKMSPPENYEDNHSIANEWAIYQWASVIKTNNYDIDQVIKNVKHQLYFKYLSTIYQSSVVKLIPLEKLKIKCSCNPKILYIDDEAEKGWHQIFNRILFEINGLEFEYLDKEFNKKNQNEIIEISLDKVKNYNFDIVILDFRLHPNDFGSANNKEVTGLRLLNKIKEFNPGIQVIIFSATNKIWNLQELQFEGADDFIVKESPENSVDSAFTYDSIEKFINAIQKCMQKLFLKEFYIKLNLLKESLLPRKNFKTSPIPLPKEFVDEVIKWQELSCNLLSKGISNTSLTASFLFLFSVLENLSNRIIDVENPIIIDNKPGKFKFEFRINKNRLRRFIEDESNPGYYRRTKTILESNRNLPWIYKILNTLDFITNEKLSEKELNLLIIKRNDIIHANSTIGNKIQIDQEMIVFLHNIIFTGLINII